MSLTKDATKLSLLGGDQELPDLFTQASVSTKGHSGPCSLVLLSLSAGCSVLMVTQAKKTVKNLGWVM